MGILIFGIRPTQLQFSGCAFFPVDGKPPPTFFHLPQVVIQKG
jgi:hypothetical protein